MAISLENLIDLSLLTYYDEKIKAYLAGSIAKEAKETAFIKQSELPSKGKEGILYVTENSIKIWDGTKYVEIGGGSTTPPSGELGSWGSF